MTLPRRPPITIHDNGIQTLADFLTRHAPTIELGWSLATQEARHAGHPTRTPDGDRTPTTNNTDTDGHTLDYHDPTGNQAVTLAHITNDLEQLANARHTIQTAVATLQKISARYLRELAPADPICTHPNCTNTVEKAWNGNGYRGCTLIGSVWTVRPRQQHQAVCNTHRKRNTR